MNNVWNGLQNSDMEQINELIGPSLGKSLVRQPKSQRKTGIVLSFNTPKGFGFIKGPGRSIFFHVSNCEDMDTVEIPVGERVSYEVGKDSAGKRCAINVRSEVSR
ncbi:MAG: cold shock domain-containing protein [Paenibacillus sp.]|uniref:cold shock domain-containing protein n=1 Tax=Paenibacillus sp. TaxID=58172 RepID=UPI0025E1C040|nr:cold shock domain-containing protein [Paenibacillus sp.]MBR2564339.1 cold shock domain-containing protein [Paenibacillus sp.]